MLKEYLVYEFCFLIFLSMIFLPQRWLRLSNASRVSIREAWAFRDLPANDQGHYPTCALHILSHPICFFCYGGWEGNYDGVAKAVENANSLKV